MVLTTSYCGTHIRHALGDSPQGGLSESQVINETGHVFVNLAQWKYLERSARLDLRGTITLVGASWTNATRTLTSTGSFTDYAFLEGDTLEITAGTGATLGFYVVESRTSANAIVLKTSIGAAASAVGATLELPAVALPPDFREIIALRGAASTNRGVQWTTHEQMLAGRAWGTGGAWSYMAALSYAPVAATTSGPPVPRLEILGSPTENDNAGLLLSYRAGWTYVSDDQQFIAIPPYCEPLFIQLLRAYAKGLEEDDIAPMEARIRGIKASDVYQDALRRDQLTQPSYGALLHGTLGDGGWPFNRTLSSQVAPPSSV